MTDRRPASLRERLRHGTARSHRALEEALDLPERIASAEDAVLVLGAFRGFVAPAEASLDAALGARTMNGRHRVPAIDGDLRAFGVDDASIAALPASRAAGRTRARAEALGALYVLEGSRLGGRLIGRSVVGRGWSPPPPFPRFWSLRPDEEGHWPSLLALLEREADEAAVIGGAEDTFRDLHAWLRASGATSDDRRDGLAPDGKRR